MFEENEVKIDSKEQKIDLQKNQYDIDFVNKTPKEREESMIKDWKELDVFHKGLRRKDGERFITYDGPPFATGVPHYGHLLAMSIKDSLSRYQALKGKDVVTLFGWDCHGVPVEHQIEKKYELKGHSSIKEKGISWFNNECRNIVFTCEKEWNRDTKRLGRVIDMDNAYKTMDSDYMESIWWVFNELNDKGLIYEGKKIVAYSPSLGTALSDFEAKLNYKEAQDPAITMMFPLQDDKKVCLLVWTTTPWSVPANVAIAINEKLHYVKVTPKDSDVSYVLAKSLLEQSFDKTTVKVEDFDIKTIIGQKYQPMFNSFSDDIEKESLNNCFKILHSDHVTEESGTGCVHICPAYGEDDHKLGLKHKLPIIDFIDSNGAFFGLKDRDVKETLVAGKQFKEADKELIKYMKDKQRMFKATTIRHQYPFCWRTDAPLMYRAVSSWYVEVTKFKDKIIENNKKVKWHPETVGKKRFHNWLENARDWAISRTRYWGNPIPIWQNIEDPTDVIFIRSKKQLEELSGKTVSDLHREFIDDIIIEKESHGKICKYKRIPEVFDCWFESGSMPYAQVHYPFENGGKDEFIGKHFPAGFIAEGLDQTRGWFYALSVIGNALFDRPPFENVVVNGILLGNDNKKMSKSKGNFPPINEVFDKYGADAVRLMLLSSPAVEAQEASIQDKSIEMILRRAIIPLMNIYKFFAEAANLNNFHQEKVINANDLKLEHELDRWFVYSTEIFKKSIREAMDNFELVNASNRIISYLDIWSTWYVRNARVRAKDGDKVTLQLMHYALDTFARYAAPIIPFATDSIFRSLYGNNTSVHFQLLTEVCNVEKLQDDFTKMERLRKICFLTNKLREKENIPLSQILSSVYFDKNLEKELAPYQEFLKELLNVQSVKWIESESKDMFDVSIQLDRRSLGKNFGSGLKKIEECYKKNDFLLDGNDLKIGGFTLLSTQGYFSVIKTPKGNLKNIIESGMAVSLDTELNSELKKIGHLRQFTRALQDCRKKGNFKMGEPLVLEVSGNIKSLIEGNENEIFKKTNTKIEHIDGEVKNPNKIEVRIGDYSGFILISRPIIDLSKSNNSIFYSKDLSGNDDGNNEKIKLTK